MPEDQEMTGSEAPGEQPAPEVEAAPAEAPSEAPAPEVVAEEQGDQPSGDESRTGFADPGLKAGDACTCPDGRKGTVHRFDAGLICLPNQG